MAVEFIVQRLAGVFFQMGPGDFNEFLTISAVNGQLTAGDDGQFILALTLVALKILGYTQQLREE